VVKKSILLLILITLFIPALLFAGGNPEVGLPKVDRLIKERNYNEAILELATYMHDNPDDFDAAQRRLRRIINLRENYNAKALELLLVLAKEPTNDKKKLDMISYLESLEKNPNASTQKFIVDTKAAAQFTYYRARFDEIMKTGDAQIDSAQYAEAAKTFQEGFVFYKQEFDDETDPELVSQVNRKLGELVGLIVAYQEMQIQFSGAVDAYRAALDAKDAALAESRYPSLDAELTRFAQVRNQIAADGWFFEDTFADIQKKNNLLTENSFLPFAYRFTLGRKTANRFEGVLGACDAHWNAAMDSLEKSANGTIQSLWTSAISSFDSGDATAALDGLSSARRIAQLARNLDNSLSRFTVRDETWGKRNYRAAAIAMERTGSLIDLMSRVGVRYGDYRKVKTSLATYEPAAVSVDAIRNAPSPAVAAWRKNIADFDAIDADATSVASSIDTLAVSGTYTADFRKWYAAFGSNIDADRLSAYVKIASYQSDSSKIIVAGYRDSYANAISLFDGIRDEGSTTVKYYPSECIASLTTIRTGITADRKALSSILDGLRKAPQDVLTAQSYAPLLSAIQNVIAELDQMFGDSAQAITRANSRVLQANLARQESDLRFNQAKSALAKSDFQGARDNLQRSRDRINASLALQENAALRKSSDDKISTLGADITRIENESVVREVRALITSGKNFYYLGNFDQAEQIFIQAKTRWGVTNIEANPEVTNWLAIINTALSMKTGRTIPVSAPLYPQMSQILNTANQLFSEGKRLMAAGKRQNAIAVLTDAKTKLQQLQLVYPLNQDAGQLTLKIDQLIDPIAFTTFFKQKVDSVRANYKTERQAAYSDLLDLYQINPQYPGIKGLVDDVEIYLGIKIPPPDPKALARSAELTKSAQKIYDANTRSMFQVALDQLDEAIKLNPDNQTAIALKDRVQTASGGQSVAVLSADDEAKYQQAVQELQKGNKITASAIVEQLLQNPKSRNSAKIQDLKKRIDSQL
jgi:hypothetical protein